MLINTFSCIEKEKNVKSSEDQYQCKVDIEQITNQEYLRKKLVDFNSEESDCLEALFSYSKVAFNEKGEKTQNNYLKAVEFIYNNSNSLSSTLIQGSVFNDIFYDNIYIVTKYLFNNKGSSLGKALQLGIALDFVVFEGKEREEKYNALYKKVTNEVKDENQRNYIVKLLDSIDRTLYD